MFETFIELVRHDVDEFLLSRNLKAAAKLSHDTGQPFHENEWPQYFTGRLDARFVLIHLNPAPKQCETKYKSFDEYFDDHQHFGRNRYGRRDRTHKSRFDCKQILFVKPFGVIEFVEEKTKEDRRRNLEKVVDEKLQLELIPYGSRGFSQKGFTAEILHPHMERMLDLICASPRDYVIFCGGIFERFFRQVGGTILDDHRFKLTKTDGDDSKNNYRFANLRVEHKGKTLLAGLAHSFAQQGIPMEKYGRTCKELYKQ